MGWTDVVFHLRASLTPTIATLGRARGADSKVALLAPARIAHMSIEESIQQDSNFPKMFLDARFGKAFVEIIRLRFTLSNGDELYGHYRIIC